MNTYIQQLMEKLKEQCIHYGQADANSILDMLYYEYISENPIETESINRQFKSLDKILSQLTLDENNAVFLLTVALCEGYAKEAFLSGVLVGVRLFNELSQFNGTDISGRLFPPN